jgi:hypothetical protein
MAKKNVKLAINIGEQDRQKFGLANDYDLKDLTEGKSISVDEKFIPHFIQHGWIATDDATAKRAEAPKVDTDNDPVADLTAPEAVDKISRMTSKDRLNEIVANDQRATVKDAAKKRLQGLQ